MRHRNVFKILISLLAVVLCITAFSITALASGYERIEDPDVVLAVDDIEEDKPMPPEHIDIELEEIDIDSIMDGVLSIFDGFNEAPKDEEIKVPQTLTPEGNMTLVDDIEGESAEDKQFITVVTKNGNYFYIIIDRTKEGENAVHFLNQVDETDLLSLVGEEGTEREQVICTCTDKCSVGNINTSCSVCLVQIGKCIGKESEHVEIIEPTEPEPLPQEPDDKKSVNTALVAFVITLLIGAGLILFLVFKPKKKTSRIPNSFDDFDLEDEEYLSDETEDIE